jgi:hypothetical protein
MATFQWMELRHASPFVVELDAIEASLLVEAVQSHGIALARKRELVESSKDAGMHHMLALIAADERAMLEAARRISDGMARAVAGMADETAKRELFAIVKPRGKEAA